MFPLNLFLGSRKRIPWKRMGPSGPVFTWTPLNLTGLVGWYDFADAASLTISDGDKIDAIANQRPGGTHPLTQAISGARPSWSGGVATFTADSHRLESAIAMFSGTASRAVFGVIEQQLAQQYTIYVNSWALVDSETQGASFGLGFYGTGAPAPATAGRLGWNGNARLIEGNQAINVADGSYHIQGLFDEAPSIANNYSFSVDGNHPTTTSVYQGALSVSSANSAFKIKGPARIKEVIVCGTYAGGETEQIEGYLAWKHGLQGNLPSGHPYKDSPP